MANEEHLRILSQGLGAWNKWRSKNAQIKVSLSGAEVEKMNLKGANLRRADFSRANLREADLRNAKLSRANLRGANLRMADLSESDLRGVFGGGAFLIGANLTRALAIKADFNGAFLSKATLNGAILKRANLSYVNLSEASLIGADLSEANLFGAFLNGANLEGADLENAILSNANLENANISNCRIYGTAAWEVNLNHAQQRSLTITPRKETTITVDDLEVGQFIYLLLNREKLRKVVDTITSKAVLILGRFTPERKAVLDAMGNELRKHNLLPIIFDFERATSRDFTETIKTLAGLSLFVIADITNPKSAPLELQATIPDYQIPFVPIIEEGEKPFSMFRDLPKYPWVLKLLTYPSLAVLVNGFKSAIIDEAFEMHKRILKEKAAKLESRSVEDYLEGGEGQKVE